MMRLAALCLAFAGCAQSALPLVIAVDLGAPGLEDDFAVIDEGGLWSVGEFGPGLRVVKAADPGGGPGFLHGGIRSSFRVNGDFAVTVTFDLLEFPAPLDDGVNDALLSVAHEDGRVFRVARRSGSAGERAVALWGGEIVGDVPSTLLRGLLRIRRVSGSRLVAEIAAPGGAFTTLGELEDGFGGAARVEVLARQGAESGGPRTPLDACFSDLVIEAVSVTGLSARLRPIPPL